MQTKSNDFSKTSTNVRINTALFDLADTRQKALQQAVKKRKAQQWLADNKAAIENCNEFAQKHGLFSDKYRMF